MRFLALIESGGQFPWWAWVIVGGVAGMFVLLWLLQRRKNRKLPEHPYNIAGMWHLSKPDQVGVASSRHGIRTVFRDAQEAADPLVFNVAADEAFEELAGDLPKGYSFTPGDCYIAVCPETYPDSNGQPALKVLSVPGHLDKYDKGGFLLAAELTTGVDPDGQDRSTPFPVVFVPNAPAHPEYLKTAMRNGFEHIAANKNNREYHRVRIYGGTWNGKTYMTESHPFFPVQ